MFTKRANSECRRQSYCGVCVYCKYFFIGKFFNEKFYDYGRKRGLSDSSFSSNGNDFCLSVHSASPKRCEIFIRAYAQYLILKRVCVPALLRARKQYKNFNSQNRKKQYFSTQIAYNRPVKIYKANNCMKNDKRRRFLSKIASVLTAFRLRPYRVRLPSNSFF